MVIWLQQHYLTLVTIFFLIVAGLLVSQVSWFFEISKSFDQHSVAEIAEHAGIWGPIAIISLMATAIVASPIPSAPIGLAAGALYGTTFGAVCIVIGAELGAMIAFFLARTLDRKILKSWFGERLSKGMLGSQNVIMTTVFFSRLIPFFSFDMISYAAGLSHLEFWRFALATFAGVVPVSIAISYFGNEVGTGDLRRATWAILGFGLITGLPILWLGYIRLLKIFGSQTNE